MNSVMTVRRYGFRFLSAAISAASLCLFATTAAAQQPNTQALLSQADEIFQQMSQITGLPIKGPVKKEVISRPEIEKYLIENIHEDTTPEELHQQEALVRVLGLVPPGFNLEKFLISFYTEQAAGFYDPKRKTMFIADWNTDETQSTVLAHELTHALQDQSWDLEDYLHGARGDDDATDARQAVVEGYATAAMFQQMAGGLDLGALPNLSTLMEGVIHSQFEEFPAFSNAPYFFRITATFPYVQGLGFIQAGLHQGGWPALKDLFEHPPQTTHQIFEPEAYFNHQPVAQVVLPHPPALEGATGLRLLGENSLGELGYYSFLGQLVSEDEAHALSPAWVADRYLLYEHAGGDDYALVARSRWASSESAQAFFRDYRTILAQKYPHLSTDQRSGADLFIGDTGNNSVLLLRKGDECVWAEGVPTAQAGALLAWMQAL